MDVVKPRERIVSILNDNDCPSFAVRRTSTPSPALKANSLHRNERPHLYRYQGYAKASSPSSQPSTPPLLRHDSSSSSTSSAMENSPSPITPEYPYLDAQSNIITPYDTMIHHAVNGYLPSPITITPLMETSMMLVPPIQDPSVPFVPKNLQAFPGMPSPAPTSNASIQPPGTAAPAPQIVQQQQPQPAAPPQQQQQQPVKKNKYPCPYVNTHGCLATFTTSGHAARHGKKHTGEKGVHCPTCGKAFTRKDNMKQHERTHKNQSSSANTSDDSRKSKASVTKQTAAERSHKRAVSEAKSASGRKDSIASPLSEVTSADMGATTLTTPASTTGEPVIFEDPVTIPDVVTSNQQPSSIIPSYPPLDEATLGQINQRPMPAFPRTFSDLDTLAMAAGAYDPYQNVTPM